MNFFGPSPSPKDLVEGFESYKDVTSVRKLHSRIELRIGGLRRGSRYVRLHPDEARILACSLIHFAEEIAPSKRQVKPRHWDR